MGQRALIKTTSLISSEFADKRVTLLGKTTLKGAQKVEQAVNLGKLPSEPKRMVANYNFDLLSDQ
jgi:hypothetical protein